jgi:hypothetical protein
MATWRSRYKVKSKKSSAKAMLIEASTCKMESCPPFPFTVGAQHWQAVRAAGSGARAGGHTRAGAC